MTCKTCTKIFYSNLEEGHDGSAAEAAAVPKNNYWGWEGGGGPFWAMIYGNEHLNRCSHTPQ